MRNTIYPILSLFLVFSVLNSCFNSNISGSHRIGKITPSDTQAAISLPLDINNLFINQRNIKIRLNSCLDTTIQVTVLRDTSLMKAQKDSAYSKTINVNIGDNNVLNLGKLDPGFYQVSFCGQNLNIGVDPEKIHSPQDKREDFEVFWGKTLEDLKKVPLNARMELVPEYSNEVRQTFRVYVDSFGGETMGGIIAIPVKEGNYPVYIEYMGYGAEPYYFNPSDNPSAINFLVSVRDQGIFKADNNNWIDRGLQSKEEFYYRGAFCDVIRAIDFVCSLPKADTKNMFSYGDSQGGAFTFISAALDHRIKAIAPSVPFLGDYEDYSKIVPWPLHEVFRYADNQGIKREELFETLSYFDVKNFADKITCPVYMAFGLQDPTCPPHTNFAIYNMVKSSKDYFCVPTCGHAMWQEAEWAQRKNEFFQAQF